jgi:hypothetical protein
VHDVTVADFVLLALDLQLPGRANRGLGAKLDEVLTRDHLGADEALLEVRVDLSRSLRARPAQIVTRASDRPQ